MIHAYINHGRWIAECPQCHWAIAIRPRQLAGSRFVCGVLPHGKDVATGCGYTDSVRFPSDAKSIEQVLRSRPTPQSNWKPGESLTNLRRENRAHGLPDGLEAKK